MPIIVLAGNRPGHTSPPVCHSLPCGLLLYGDSMTPVSLLADPVFIRAWMDGVGDYKLGG